MEAAPVYPLPAHQTKALKFLDYPLPDARHRVRIEQNDSVADSTGRTVWLGAQVLAVYLHALLASDKAVVKGRRKRVIELGAGTGMLSLMLHHCLQYDVVSTDVPMISNDLLRTNLASNVDPASPALLQARALDWFADPSTWDFSRWSISPPPPPQRLDAAELAPPSEEELLVPPFDMILTTDSIYDFALSQPLLRTIHALSTPPLASKTSPPPTFVALEVRDPDLIDAFMASAKEDWGFKCSRVENGRLAKLLGEEGFGWADDDWDGVQVWKLVLARKAMQKR